MAHELDYTTGRAAFLSVKETAWHRDGTVLADHPGFEQALEVAELDYRVKVVPAFKPIYDAAGNVIDTIESKVGRLVIREDSNAELGAVGTSYVPVQNREAFGVLRPLIEAGHLRIETAGALRSGADAWMLVQFNRSELGPVADKVFNGGLGGFGLVSTNHSGRRGVILGLTPVRVVCANTLGMAESQGLTGQVTIRHTGDAGSKMIEAAEALFGDIINRYEVIARSYAAMKAITLSAEQFERTVLNVIAPDPRTSPKFNPEAKLAESVLNRAAAKREALTAAWTGGKGHTGDRSAWEAYNGAVEVLDHNRDLFPTRAGAWRTASLLDGTLRDLKNDVLSAITREVPQYAEALADFEATATANLPVLS